MIRAVPLALIILAAGCSERLPLGSISGLVAEWDASDAHPEIVPLDAADRCMPCNDFPANPIIAGGAPANAPGLFATTDGSAPTGAPACLMEPQDRALFPNNWQRPRFRLKPADPLKQYIYEIRLHATSEANDLVVYTANPSWTMPKEIWPSLVRHVVDEPITMSIRSAEYDGSRLLTKPVMGTIGTFAIAPVPAEGTLVYWTSKGNVLKGFSPGDEVVNVVLQPSQTSGRCVGCHASTPDGLFVGHEVSDSPTFGLPARVEFHSVNGQAIGLPFLTGAAQALLSRPDQLTPSFSEAHWQPGDRLAFSLYLNEIIWTDLETSSMDPGIGWGIFNRTGDLEKPFSFATSHDGTRVAYASSDLTKYGTQNEGESDLHVIPFGDRAGGTSVPLEGASHPSLSEYYPTFSPDDKFIAFARIPAGQTSKHNPLAEIEIIPSMGGSAIRLDANDPPACSGAVSPGVTNSWPRWAPQKGSVGDRTYYWLVFSSRRTESNTHQIYVTGVVVSGASVATHTGIYLWNQPADEANHMPSWDRLQIRWPQ